MLQQLVRRLTAEKEELSRKLENCEVEKTTLVQEVIGLTVRLESQANCSVEKEALAQDLISLRTQSALPNKGTSSDVSASETRCGNDSGSGGGESVVGYGGTGNGSREEEGHSGGLLGVGDRRDPDTTKDQIMQPAMCFKGVDVKQMAGENAMTPTFFLEGTNNLRSFTITFWVKTPSPCKQATFRDHWFDGCGLVTATPPGQPTWAWSARARRNRIHR